MTNRLADGRQRLVDALGPTMTGDVAGRVHPYRVAGRPAAPSMWIESPSVTKVEGRIVATYTVIGVVDGADESQQALLDDMSSRAWDACQAAEGLRPRLLQPRDIPAGGALNSSSQSASERRPEALRGFALSVELTVNAVTLCPPAVETVIVPPTLVEVT